MPFTDVQLASAMNQELVAASVMTAPQKEALLKDPTEIEVRKVLSDEQLANFQRYWGLLGNWMADQE